jgi:tetratricopeptide (TPR) repeat protein
MKQKSLSWISTMVFALCWIIAASARAEENPEFARANRDYSEGRYQEAVEGYESLVQSGKWNPTVFYDLGNAYFRLRNFGKAILNYERALALDPRHPEAVANLQLARDEARALELRKDWIERYASFATVQQYSISASVAFWIAVFLGVRWLFSRRWSFGRAALIVMGLILCGASGQAIYELERARGNALAIVTGPGVEARLATADNAKGILVLPPGSEINILSERGDWIYAALPNDLRGWLPSKSAERVRL